MFLCSRLDLEQTRTVQTESLMHVKDGEAMKLSRETSRRSILSLQTHSVPAAEDLEVAATHRKAHEHETPILVT